jgi:hypothetical protein
MSRGVCQGTDVSSGLKIRVSVVRFRPWPPFFIPESSEEDPTRDRSFYDPTFEYLLSLGIPVID